MMLSHLKLGSKFTLLLSLVFISGIVISGFALSQALMKGTEKQIASKGLVLLETMSSVRDYSNIHISPLLRPQVYTQQEFISESVPSYSVREVFETLRKKPEYKNFLYKDATLNPTNLRDKADGFETQLVKQFRKEPQTKELSGYRMLFGEKVFYIARPLAITEPSCLGCHSTPEAAPKSQLAKYGDKHGFGWNLNEIIGTQTIYVPAEQVLESARSSFLLIIGVFIGIFALVILLINFLLKRSVIHPIRIMARLAQTISENENLKNPEELQPDGLAKVANRADELGQLGRVFEDMARELYAREQSLKQQVYELRIKIDEAQKDQQVAEITESDYFKQLQNKAKDFRNRSKDSSQ
ncbi:MAG TPA: DUF3365 domain-containing protein [Coleofasciculaceae cyanobacterium]